MILSYDDYITESRRFIVRVPNSNVEYYVKVPNENAHEIVRLERNSEVVDRWVREIGDFVKLNGRRLKVMTDRNALATSILYRLLMKKEVSSAEYDFLTRVTADNLKVLGIGLIASPIIPGGIYTLPILFRIANQHNIDLYPEVWRLIKSENKELIELPSYINKIKKMEELEKSIQRFSKRHKNEEYKKLEDRINMINKFLDERYG